MTGHVYQKFPHSTEVIRALLREDPAFAEMCADYEEICSWLAGHCSVADGPSEDCDRAREVMNDLEAEIGKVLRDGGF